MLAHIRRITYITLIGSMFLHLFCCGIPLVMSVLSLAASTGLILPEIVESDTLHHYEEYLVIFSGTLLVLTGVLQWIAARYNCVDDGDCSHEPCDRKKITARQIYAVSCGLFLINLFLLFSHAHD